MYNYLLNLALRDSEGISEPAEECLKVPPTFEVSAETVSRFKAFIQQAKTLLSSG